MAEPTMDLLLAALDAGELDEVRALAERMRSEWGMLHDLLVEMVTGLASFVHEEGGDAAVARAWERCFERSWRRHVEAIATLERRAVVPLLARTWRAHSLSGTGRDPAAFTIAEDEEKVTFTMLPCGSGQRLVRRGAYEGDDPYATTDQAHDWSYGRAGFPIYCTHCTFMNEILPLRWIGMALYPSEPPTDFAHDPCVWHWYKDPEAIPSSYAARYQPVTIRPRSAAVESPSRPESRPPAQEGSSPPQR